jgi:hypothetical protein
MSEDRTETWEALAARFEGYDHVPAAQANARLIRRAAPEWEGRALARGSMHDVLFTLPGDAYPFTATVRLHWEDDVFEFVLARKGLVVTADRCLEPNTDAVLASFLMQLVGDP